MTVKGSTIDPKVEENTRIQSASEKNNKVAILSIWARETIKTPQERNTRSELYSSIVKCVEGRGHQDQMCLASPQIRNFEKIKSRWLSKQGLTLSKDNLSHRSTNEA